MLTAINDLMERLRGSLDVQRRFIANASHELRSPLSALTIQIENVYRLPLDRELRARLEPLRLGIERARSLTEQLLTLARVQMPDPHAPADCNVENVTRLAIEGLLPVAEAKNVQIVVTSLQPVAVESSEVDLVIVVRNLLANAIRYSDPDATVEVGMSTDASDVIIEVRDFGRGIPDEERPRVFDPFYRILGSAGEGNGLGLSIVKTIVDRLNARIELDWTMRNPDRGLTVRVVLLHLPAQGKRHPASAPHLAIQGRGAVLLKRAMFAIPEAAPRCRFRLARGQRGACAPPRRPPRSAP